MPDIHDIIDAYALMHGGKRKGRPQRPPGAEDDFPLAVKEALHFNLQKENREAHHTAIHVSMLPLSMQRGIKEMADEVKRKK